MNTSDTHPSTLTLTTDFGVDDPYVGIMKGVILGICPHARLVDLSHTVPQGDIVRASLILRSAVRYFPSGTIHLAVVDPGVGGERLPVAIHAGDMYLVGPNNGLFWFLNRLDPPPKVVELAESAYHLPNPSHTFHGRDIFAPVAAHLARGIQLSEFGPQANTLTSLSLPEIERIDMKTIGGRIIYIDHFGNCISNIAPVEAGLTLDRSWAVELDNGRNVPVDYYYGQVPLREPLALVGSSGHLEIAVRNGSAKELLHLNIGTRFLLRKL